MSREKHSSGFAVFIILIGIAVLLINMDILRLDMFWGIIHLWPLLLVLGGLSILFRKVRHFDVVLWLVFFGIVIAYSYLNMDQKSWFIGEKVASVAYEQEVSEVDEGHILLDVSTGSLMIGGYDGDNLNYKIPEVGLNTHDFEITSTDVAELTLKESSSSDFVMAFQQKYFEMNLPEEQTWSLNIDAAVLDGELNLNDLKMKDVKIDYAVGDLEVLIGEETFGAYNIDFAVGNLVIDLPENENIRVYCNGGLSSIDYPKSFTSKDDYYYSKDYDQNEPFIDIYIDLAVGTVEIK